MKLRRLVIIVATLIIISLFGVSASADSTPMAIVTCGSTVYNCNSVEDVNSKIAGSSGNVTVELKRDMAGGPRLEIPENKNVTINMNGFEINRGLTDDKNNGECIAVRSKANLTVNGGKVKAHSNIREYYDEDGNYRTVKINASGLITGGYSANGGGGIHVSGTNATITLNDVWIIGNRAEQWLQQDGYGGGICVYDDSNRIVLNRSHIEYNYAYNDGGGIYVSDDDGNRIYLNESHIDNNRAQDEGGGICVDCEDYSISGDGKSSISGNVCYDGYGGGIYLWNDDGNVSGLTIANNTASSDGGGIYVKEENVKLTNLTITGNSADDGAGIFVNNDYCTIDTCTVTGNNGRESCGGVFWAQLTEGSAICGPTVIKDNTVGGKATYKSNMYKGNTIAYTLYNELNLSEGADVHLGIEPTKDTQISDTRVNVYRDGWVTCDNPGYYVKWNTDLSQGYQINKTFYLEATQDKSEIPTVEKVAVSGDPELQAQGYGNYDLVAGYLENGASDSNAKFFYSDGYFEEDPHDYNNHLATLSSCFVAAAGGDDKRDVKSKHHTIRKFLADIGCDDDDIYVNDYNIQTPETDSIGVGIGSKMLKTSDGQETGDILIAVGIRGSNYGREWASNVTLGSSGEAQGFKEAADITFDEVNKYIKDNDLADEAAAGKIKFWVCGYSRAGATANLAGKRLIDKYQAAGNDIFGYALEPAQGGSADCELATSDYKTLHCMINRADMVPRVAPDNMNFKHYGVEHYIPGTEAESATKIRYGNCESDNESIATLTEDYYKAYAKMRAQIDGISPSNAFSPFFDMYTLDFVELALNTGGDRIYKIMAFDEAATYGVTQEEFLDIFFKKLQEWVVKDRQHYSQDPIVINGKQYDTIEQGFRDLCAIAMGPNGGTVIDALKNHYLDAVRNKVGDYGLYDDLIGDWDTLSESKRGSYITKLMDAADAAGAYNNMTEEEKAKFNKAFPAVIDTVLRFEGTDYHTKADSINSSWSSQDTQILLGTFLKNASRILQDHYIDTNMAWLRIYDSFYENEGNITYVIADESKNLEKPAATAVDPDGKTSDLSAEHTNAVLSDTKIKLATATKGDAIYYEIIKDGESAGVNLYRGQFKMTADGSSDNEYTIRTYSLLNRKISESIEYNIAVVDKNTKILFNDGINDEQVIDATTGSYISLVAPDEDSQYIKSWKITRYDYDGTGATDVTDKVISGDTAGIKSLTFTMPEYGSDEVFAPGYYLAVTVERENPVNKAGLEISEPQVDSPLADTATLHYTDVNGKEQSETFNVGWYYRYGDNLVATSGEAMGGYAYLATIQIDDIDSPRFFSSDMKVSFYGDEYEGANIDYASRNIGDRRTASITASYATLYGEPAEDNSVLLTVNEYDINTNSNMVTSECRVDPGKVITLTAPDASDHSGEPNYDPEADPLSNMIFSEWDLTDCDAVLVDENGEATGKTTSTDRTIRIKVSSSDDDIKAVYMPILNEVNIEVDAPVACEKLEEHPKSAKVKITNEYSIDPDSIKLTWGPAPLQDGTADYNTYYSVKAELTGDSIQFTDSESSASGIYTVSPYLKVTVNGDSNNAGIHVEEADEGQRITNLYYNGFAITDKKPVELVSVGTLADAYLDYGASGEEIRAALPEKVGIKVSDASIDKATIEWGGAEKTGNEFDGYIIEITGTVKLPEDIQNPDNISLTVKMTIHVDRAPSTTAPVASVKTGVVYEDFTVTLSGAEEGAEVYYTLNDGTRVPYTGEITISRSDAVDDAVYLEAIAVKDGLHDGINVYKYRFEDAAVSEKNLKDAKVSAVNKVYTGKAITPSFKVTLNGETVPAEGYKLAVSNNTNVGLARCKLEGKGEYKGSVAFTFEISPTKSYISKAVRGKKKISVTMRTSVAKTGGTYYQYQIRKKGTKKWKTVTSKKRTVTIKKLKSHKKYQIRVRAYKKVGSKYYYGAWSSIKTTKKVK